MHTPTKSVTVILSDSVSFDAAILDAFRDAASLSETNLVVIADFILQMLRPRLQNLNLRILGLGQAVYPNSGIVQSPVTRFPRSAFSFSTAVFTVVNAIIEELFNGIKHYEGKALLEVGYSDDPSFDLENNLFRDYGYLFARIIKIEA